ncbi:MAG TPA: hypothetical protein VEF04_04695 [Blastocatellia bacterium]|nr:hypothetical protein [Blastocatellia bacterium]
MEIEILENAGALVNCSRCGIVCQIAQTANKEARPLKHAAKEGCCVACALTGFLKLELEIEHLLPPGTDISEALKMPHIQQQFGRVFIAGQSDVTLDQINWERVTSNWDLPVVLKRRGRRS